MKRSCSCWLELVACVILYKDDSLFNFKFLLIQREDGKWAIPGGIGASELTKNLYDFAAFECNYDTNFYPLSTELKEFRTILSSCGRKITVFFSCKIEKYDIELKGKWFSLEDIVTMDEKGEIAFNNAEIIKEFILGRKN